MGSCHYLLNMSKSSTNESTAERESVRESLLAAFKTATMPDKLSHDECVAMRTKLSLVSEKDLPGYLLPVLLDLLDSHTNYPENQFADFVILFLDDSRRIETKELCRTARERDIAKYMTSQQARAILHWLKYARNWPVFQLWEDEINSAILYWQKSSPG